MRLYVFFFAMSLSIIVDFFPCFDNGIHIFTASIRLDDTLFISVSLLHLLCVYSNCNGNRIIEIIKEKK